MKHKNIVAFFSVSLLFSMSIRIIQLMFMIEPDTGFVKPEYGNLQTALTAGLFFIIIAFTVFSALSRRRPLDIEELPIKPLGVFAAVTAAAQLIEVAILALSSTFDISNMLMMLFLLLSSSFFILFSISIFTGNRIPMFASVFPVILYVYKLVASFISYTGIANISENMFDVAMLCVTLFFFLLHGKYLSEVTSPKKSRIIFPVGLVASLFCFLCTIPRYAIILLGASNILHESALPNISDFIMGVYIAAFVLICFRKGKRIKRVPTIGIIPPQNQAQPYDNFLLDSNEEDR